MEITNVYSQFCPVSMASEVLCTRWTPLIVRELLCGSERFTQIKRGVPKMSPTLLSKRLKELEMAGVITTRPDDRGTTVYRLTEAGEDMRPLVMGLGEWGQRWVESRLSLRNLDPSLLMWDIRRNFVPDPVPSHRLVVQFSYPALKEEPLRDWWLLVDASEVDLCNSDPGHDVDILVTADLRAMTMVWMGLIPIAEEIAAERIAVDAPPILQRRFADWLKLSVFAGHSRRVS